MKELECELIYDLLLIDPQNYDHQLLITSKLYFDHQNNHLFAMAISTMLHFPKNSVINWVGRLINSEGLINCGEHFFHFLVVV